MTTRIYINEIEECGLLNVARNEFECPSKEDIEDEMIGIILDISLSNNGAKVISPHFKVQWGKYPTVLEMPEPNTRINGIYVS